MEPTKEQLQARVLKLEARERELGEAAAKAWAEVNGHILAAQNARLKLMNAGAPPDLMALVMDLCETHAAANRAAGTALRGAMLTMRLLEIDAERMRRMLSALTPDQLLRAQALSMMKAAAEGLYDPKGGTK